MNDSISDAASDDFQLKINTELTKTNDTTSDTINTSHGSPTSVAEIQSSSTGDNLFDFIEKCLLSLNPEMTMALGSLTYHTDFHPHYFPPEKEGAFGKTLYKRMLTGGKDEADKLGLVFIGEIFGLWDSNLCEGKPLCQIYQKPKGWFHSNWTLIYSTLILF